MKTPRHRIADFLAERSLDPSVDAKKLSREIAAFLLETGRSGELSSLARDIMQRRADQGVVEVTAVTAHPLTSDLRQDIKDKIRAFYPQAKRISINDVIDPNLLGGIRLELANDQLDLSVRSKLNRFKQLTSGKD